MRAIEPLTEADPAALLFQFLVGFGSLVGREPHTVADASRHGCNLFAAIVGVSSKGRKGTARDYCEASARFIFGDSLGYSEADWILTALRGNSYGSARTEVRDLFVRNQNESMIQAALMALEERGLAGKVQEQTGGRPAERWLTITPATT